MNTTQSAKLKHLQWAIESRFANQQCAVHLFRLFLEYEEQWKTKPWARAAQALLSASFSLWRAAFLADKTAKRSAVFSHGKYFLEKLIEDNAISYVQDRKSNEWTFNYYTGNAKTALETLHKNWPEQVSAYVQKTRTPIEKWQYCQELLKNAVEQFESAAHALQTERLSGEEARKRRSIRKAQRKKVRALTIAARKSGEGSPT